VSCLRWSFEEKPRACQPLCLPQAKKLCDERTAVPTRRLQISKTKEADAGKGNWDRAEVRHSRENSWSAPLARKQLEEWNSQGPQGKIFVAVTHRTSPTQSHVRATRVTRLSVERSAIPVFATRRRAVTSSIDGIYVLLGFVGGVGRGWGELWFDGWMSEGLNIGWRPLRFGIEDALRAGSCNTAKNCDYIKTGYFSALYSMRLELRNVCNCSVDRASRYNLRK